MWKLYQITYAKNEPGDDNNWQEYSFEIVSKRTGSELKLEILDNIRLHYFSRPHKHYPYELVQLFKKRQIVTSNDVKFKIVSLIDFGEEK